MHTRWLADSIAYDGTQLRAHWILRATGLVGDALVAFRGSCDVPAEEIADLADLDGPGIAGEDMVHFIAERFDAHGGLAAAVARQRLFTCLAAECLVALAPGARERIERRGDDLYVDGRKLSISVATASPVSVLQHFAVNVATRGVPVPAAGLGELGVEPREFADLLLARAVAEEASMDAARAKVRARGEA